MLEHLAGKVSQAKLATTSIGADMNNEQMPTMGELLTKSGRDGYRTITIVALVLFLLIGVGYTGVHNWNLFARTVQPDQKIFAVIPVILLEGSLLLLTAGGFFWFSGGAQKIVATTASWVFLGVIAVNTMLDSQLTVSGEIPAWLAMYRDYVLYGTPVAMLAVLKAVLDLSPAKRELDMQMAIEHAMTEGKFNAMRVALSSETNRLALGDYARTFAQQIAEGLRAGAVAALPAPAATVEMAKATDDAPSVDEPMEAPKVQKAKAPKA